MGTNIGTRAGRFVRQPGGFDAYVPAPLPPDPTIAFDAELVRLLSDADQGLGRLDGIVQTLPNPDLFVAMYVRREAVLSSQIEGTQSTLEDLLAVEIDPGVAELARDVDEIVNYVAAMNYGLDRLGELPLSLRLIREIHGRLLHDVRGANHLPGQFRRSQNFIAQAGARDISDAIFVPPPVPAMKEALHDFEKFLHGGRDLPKLVHVGLAHAQFETIHPFVEGNGRVGRLLITFLLVHHGILARPVLYLSLFLKRHRDEYYDHLMAIRHAGDWEGWLRFFVRGVAETADEATATARAIVQLREDARARIQEHNAGTNALRLVDALFVRPVVHVRLAADLAGVSFATASKLVDKLQSLALLSEITGRKRDRLFRFDPYLALFADDERRSRRSRLQTTTARL